MLKASIREFCSTIGSFPNINFVKYGANSLIQFSTKLISDENLNKMHFKNIFVLLLLMFCHCGARKMEFQAMSVPVGFEKARMEQIDGHF